MCLSLKSCLRTLVVLLILKHLYFWWWDFGTLEYYVYLCFNFMMLLMQLLISLSLSIFSVCWNWFWKDTIRYWCHELMDMHDINIYIYVGILKSCMPMCVPFLFLLFSHMLYCYSKVSFCSWQWDHINLSILEAKFLFISVLRTWSSSPCEQKRTRFVD